MESTISHRSESSICNDILFEILSWLPAKSLIRNSPFLSKNLISEPKFIHEQTKKTSYFDSGFFLQRDKCQWAPKDLAFHVLPSKSSSAFGIPHESLGFLMKKARILTSVQGLVLFHDIINGKERFSICNPVTMTFVAIPVPEYIVTLYQYSESGFILACDPRNPKFSNDFIITAPFFVDIEDDPWNPECYLVVYRNGQWEPDTCDLRLEPCRKIQFRNPVGVFSGPHSSLVVHYICDTLPNVTRRPVFLEPYVAAFDMERKTLWKKLKVSEGAWEEDDDHQKLKIFKWGKAETVGLVKTDGIRLSIWVLESYTPAAAWRKVVDKTTSEMGVPEEEGEVGGFSVVNGKGLLFTTWSRVYWYEMEGADVGTLEVVAEHGFDTVEFGFREVDFILYANTLRPVHGAFSLLKND